MVETNPLTGEIAWSSTVRVGTPDLPDRSTANGRCYDEEFSWIEFGYSVGNPDVIAGREIQADHDWESAIRPCLVANGIDAPDTRPPTESDAYGELLDQYVLLAQADRCAAGED